MNTETINKHFRNFTLKELSNPEYIYSKFNNGTYCKLCQTTYLYLDRDSHLREHLEELKVLRSEETIKEFKPREPREPKAPPSPFYDHKCACGGSILRTGRKGRPSLKCEKCKKK